MRWIAGIIFVGLVVASGGTLGAEEEETERVPGPPPPGEASGQVELVAIRDGERLLLKEGEPLRFAAIRAPYPPIGQQPGRWPPVQVLSRRIKELADEGLILYPAGGSDRYGDRLANLWSLKEEAWLAEVLAGEGLALVAPAVLFDPEYGPVTAAERAARETGLGIWSNPMHRVLCAGEAQEGIDQLRVVQGRIRETRVAAGFLYLNFGADWRRDFTLRLKAGRGARRAEQLLLARDLQDHVLEVRGWLYFRGGPMIDLDNLGRISIIAADARKC
jgi:endonuclease YncB( thermonuclease family)